MFKDIVGFWHDPALETQAVNGMIKNGNITSGNHRVDYSTQQYKRHSLGVDLGWLCGEINLYLLH